MNEAMKQAWLEISQMLGEPTREELDVFLRTWQRAMEAQSKAWPVQEPAQQEPVAYLCENAVSHKYFRWKKPSSTYKPIALYTALPQRPWVGLTHEEAEEVWKRVEASDFRDCVHPFSQAIEGALRSKNT